MTPLGNKGSIIFVCYNFRNLRKLARRNHFVASNGELLALPARRQAKKQSSKPVVSTNNSFDNETFDHKESVRKLVGEILAQMNFDDSHHTPSNSLPMNIG